MRSHAVTQGGSERRDAEECEEDKERVPGVHDGGNPATAEQNDSKSSRDAAVNAIHNRPCRGCLTSQTVMYLYFQTVIRTERTKMHARFTKREKKQDKEHKANHPLAPSRMIFLRSCTFISVYSAMLGSLSPLTFIVTASKLGSVQAGRNPRDSRFSHLVDFVLGQLLGSWTAKQEAYGNGLGCTYQSR